ncbi:hypothetical protein ABZS29_17920 [Kribbella sp. NPDC005582]|uniref:hypothetical protein n=1 Tax=Kribbella sp. NPDC005582 TaxID=3156893 RepID=UPI0033B7C86A
MYKSKTSRTLGRAAVAAAALASVALLPAGVANATPLTAEAAPATAEFVTCTIHGQPGQPIAFYNVQWKTLIGYVYDGQKLNMTGRDSEMAYGVLWGRTDVTMVATRYVYC